MAKARKEVGASPEETRDLRGAIEWLKKEGDLIETDREVNPDLEITGIQKQLDGGCHQRQAQTSLRNQPVW